VKCVNSLVVVTSLPPRRSLPKEPLQGREADATHDEASGGGVGDAVVMRSRGLLMIWWCILMRDGVG